MIGRPDLPAFPPELRPRDGWTNRVRDDGRVLKTVAEFAGGDVASELMLAVRIESSVLCRSVMAPPWGFGVASRDAGSFHLVLDGGGWLEVDGAANPIRLDSGDLVLLPSGNAHWVRDAPTSAAPALTSILAEHAVVDGELHFGGRSGPLTELVCGIFRLAGGRKPLISLGAIPPVIHVPAGSGSTWWPGVFVAVRDEARAPTAGGSAVVNRLLESIVADAVGVATRSLDDGLASPTAHADPRIGAALAVIRQHLDRPWSVADLAAYAAMSRSAFAARFRAVVGMPPHTYITRLRLSRAAELLRTTDATVAAIARQVGYASEEAFSRAFKDQFGTSPSVFRRRQS
jgi:AraC-like DNA-binding protein